VKAIYKLQPKDWGVDPKQKCINYLPFMLVHTQNDAEITLELWQE
jgi:hypothetical protein